MSLPVVYADIQSAMGVLNGVAHRTPVLTSRHLDARVGARVFLKCENFQRAGAFKFRGAFNALARLSPDERKRGVVTFSSGNHAQAVALAGQELDIPRVIVMPDDAPAIKLTATRGYGAEVVVYNRATDSREAIARKLQEERGMVLIPPFDHPHVIAGQGTAAVELFQETGPLDALFVCVGGGGLISGCAIAAKHLYPGCTVIGVEPEAGDDATRSFHSGTLQSVDNPQTIADGARTTSLGKLTFPIIRAKVDDMITVTDDSLREMMHLLWERMKIVVEPTGVLGLAGLAKVAEDWKDKRIGILISGGNVDFPR